MEIAEAHGTPHLIVVEEVGEILLGEFGEVEEGIALVLSFFLFLGLFLLLDLDIVFPCQPAEGFGIGEVFVFLKEGDHVASLAAAEAFEDAFGGGDIEGGRLLVVEGATAYVVGSALLERDEVTYHLLDAGGVHDPLYGLLVYHRNKLQKYDFFFT